MTTNGYPFTTRRAVLERLDRDPAFVRTCVEILHRRYLDRALLPPPAGWMSSHKKAGEGIHARLASDAFTAADIVTAAKIAKRYAKQLAKVFRDEQLARDPGLAVAAAVFGVRRTDDQDLDDGGDDPYAEIDGERDDVDGEPALADAPSETPPAPTVVVAPSETELAEAAPKPATDKRRPGRPRGSKNKPKSGTGKPAKRGRRA